jgi:acetyltransferase-like isoleucine patch superfamily enzyme
VVKRLAEKLRWLPHKLGYRWGPLLASRIRRRWVLLRHPHANIQIDPTAYLGPGFSLHVDGPGTFVAGPGTEFRRGFRAEVSGDGRIAFGRGCVCTYYVLMQCSTEIDIGDHVMFGQSTIVVDGQHRFRDLSKPMLSQGYDFSPIRIGDDATITTKCSIMAGVGTRTFVGANAVVTRELPPYCVCVGAPARPIDYFGPPGQEPEELTTPSTP